MQIIHEEKDHAFVMRDESGLEIGRLDYRTGGGRLNAMRTFVALQYRHKGYATQLVDALADYARTLQTTIVPICSFVQLVFMRYPDKYADVAAPPPGGTKA